MQTLGKKISQYRKMKGMTQEDLAEKMNVSSQAVSKWENDLSIPDLPILIELANCFNITLDELVKQKEDLQLVQVVEEPLRRPLNQMMFRIVVESKDGDKVRVNLPMTLIKAGIEMGMSLPEFNGKEVLKGIDIEQILMLVEKGVMGKLVEVNSADGDHVEIFVE